MGNLAAAAGEGDSKIESTTGLSKAVHTITRRVCRCTIAILVSTCRLPLSYSATHG